MQWVWDRCNLNFNNSSTVTVTKTGNGFTFHAAPASGNSSVVNNFPFKIYLAQGDQLSPDADPADAPFSFLVREGRYGNTPVTGDGMDGYDLNPDSDFFPTVNVKPIVIPDEVGSYYFWIELTYDDGPVLRSGDDPANEPNSVIQWTTFPKNDGYHIIIGELQTVVNEAGDNEIIPRQLLRADIPVPLEIVGCKNGQPVTYELTGSFDPPETPP